MDARERREIHSNNQGYEEVRRDIESNNQGYEEVKSEIHSNNQGYDEVSRVRIEPKVCFEAFKSQANRF